MPSSNWDQGCGGLESESTARDQIRGNLVLELAQQQCFPTTQMKNRQNSLFGTSISSTTTRNILCHFFLPTPSKWVTSQEHSSIVIVFIAKAPCPDSLYLHYKYCSYSVITCMHFVAYIDGQLGWARERDKQSDRALPGKFARQDKGWI